MNFLSHFYFDRETDNCYHILGTILPDLLKNADKNIVLHPEKLKTKRLEFNHIITGWNKHLEVDRYFHSSEFFKEHAHHLKNRLKPAILESPVKPFFLGHIALELLLDNLLITSDKIVVDEFYTQLMSCEKSVINEFLLLAGLKETESFHKFFDDFNNSKYLHSYANTNQVAYALKRICMRVWSNPFTPKNEQLMNEILATYRLELTESFTDIFDEIEIKLSNNPCF